MTDEKLSNKTLVVMTIFISILGGAGVNMLDGVPSALDNVYVCSVNEDVGEFFRLSSTHYTGYPNEFDSKGYSRCKDSSGNKGVWVSAIKFAEENGINLSDLIETENKLEFETTPIEDKPIITDDLETEKPKSHVGKSYTCDEYNACVEN